MTNFQEDEKKIVVHIKDGKAEIVNNPDNVRVHVVNYDDEFIKRFPEERLGSKEKEFRCCYCLKSSSEYDWSVATLMKTTLIEGTLSQAIHSYENSSWDDVTNGEFYCPLCFERNDSISIAEGAKYRGNGRWK